MRAELLTTNSRSVGLPALESTPDVVTRNKNARFVEQEPKCNLCISELSVRPTSLRGLFMPVNR